MQISIILDIVCFFILITTIVFIKDKLTLYFKNKSLKSFSNWLPIEQIKELRQLFYLIFAGFLIFNFYYLIIINTSFNYLIGYVIFDFIISVCAGVYIFDKNKKIRTAILLLTLIPFTGLSITGINGVPPYLFVILEIIHSLSIIFIIFIIIADFKKYSTSNRLGYTILLLFIIVFVCIFLTTYAENISLVDSIVYCSNAFTSNGYGLVNASNFQGKIISVILVWSGYILSGVSTALLTIALMTNTYKKRIRVMKKRMDIQDKRLREMDKKLDELLNK